MCVALSMSGRSQQRQSRKRGPPCDFSFSERNIRDLSITALHQSRPEFVLRKSRLYQDFTGTRLAPGPACNLDNRLRHTLATAKIGTEQTLVRIHDADQRQVGEVMPLRQHLCADKNIRVTGCRVLQGFLHSAFALCAIAVNSADDGIGKATFQRFFDSLSTLAKRFDRFIALIANFVERPANAAVMTPKLLAPGMYGEPRIAAVATSDVSAAITDQCRRKTTTIQKYQNLVSGTQVLCDRCSQRLADTVCGRRSNCVDKV